MIRRSHLLENNDNEVLYTDLRYSEGTKEAPAVVLVHGFKGFKDWGFFPDLASRLADSGFVTVSFNFSRNGVGSDPNNFTELESFANNTISHELSDLERIFQAIRNGEIGRREIDKERISLMGHSRGGGIAALFAVENPEYVQALITWASINTFNRYSSEQIAQWKKQGYIEIENVRTKQMMRINRSFWEDIMHHEARLNIMERIQDMETPTLFVHGSADTTVSPEESSDLHDRCGASFKRLEIIEEGDHTFGIKHPMESTTEAYQTAFDLTEHWLDNILNI